MFKFSKSYSVCQQCKVHFEPHKGRHPELCATHRDPVIHKEDRIARVMEWAERNWEKLEPEARKEAAELAKRFQDTQNAQLSAMYAAQGPWGLGSLGQECNSFPPIGRP